MWIINKIERWTVTDEDGQARIINPTTREAAQFTTRAAAQFAADELNKGSDY